MGGHGGGMMRWLITYADMITLLLALFVVFFAMANQDLQKFEALAKSLRQGFAGPSLGATIPFDEGGAQQPIEGGGLTRLTTPIQIFNFPRFERQLQEQLKRILKEKGLKVKGAEIKFYVNERGVVIDIHPAELLFDTGKADLKPELLPILEEIAKVLKDLPNPIAIEGHTDPRPINTVKFPSNWELSAARAAAVLRFFEEKGVPRWRMRIAGYADTRPIASNDTTEGMARNRRVQIVILRGETASEEKPAAGYLATTDDGG